MLGALVLLIALLALLATAAALAVGWLVSNRFLVPKSYALMPEFEILDVDEDGSEDGSYLVALPRLDRPSQFSDVAKEGIYNLIWQNGYGRLGPVASRHPQRVVRRLTDIVGEPPSGGAPARIDVTIYHRGPLADHGIDFEELELAGKTGKLHAWWIGGGGERAVLALHGRRRADRTDTLRILPTLVKEGWSVMSLAYRNHDRSDPSPDRFFHYGQSEADDALAAVEELARRGVREVVLYGISMGGAVALEAARRWPPKPPELAGIVLDSPLLDPRTVIRKGARDAGLPIPLADLALAVGRYRSGVNWAELDQRRSAGQISAPVLLIAGTDDHTIPIELVDEFASLVSAPIEYLRLDGVDHVEGWNRARPRYEGAVGDFLSRAASEVAGE